MKIENLKEIELGYLIGFFLGDGYMFYNPRDRHYSIEFYPNSEKDKDIAKYLKGLLISIGLNPLLRKDKRYNVLRIRVNSKEFMKFIDSRTKNLKRAKLSDKYKIGLLSGFIDAEGYVGNGEIVVSQSKKSTLLFFRKICNDFGLKTHLWSVKNSKTSKRLWRLRISTKLKYIPNNSYKIRRIYSGAMNHSERS